MNRKEIICRGDELFRLIPQRPPMVMIDRFYGIEENTSWSGLAVTPDNLFCRDGVLQETGIIEHIAQSAAARVGYIYMLREEPVPLGFIGSVEKNENIPSSFCRSRIIYRHNHCAGSIRYHTDYRRGERKR